MIFHSVSGDAVKIINVHSDLETVDLTNLQQRSNSRFIKRNVPVSQLIADGGIDEIFDAVEKVLIVTNAITELLDAMAAYSVVNYYHVKSAIPPMLQDTVLRLIEKDLIWLVPTPENGYRFVYMASAYFVPYTVELPDGTIATITIGYQYATARFMLNGVRRVVQPIFFHPHGLRAALHICIQHVIAAVAIAEIEGHGTYSD